MKSCSVIQIILTFVIMYCREIHGLRNKVEHVSDEVFALSAVAHNRTTLELECSAVEKDIEAALNETERQRKIALRLCKKLIAKVIAVRESRVVEV